MLKPYIRVSPEERIEHTKLIELNEQVISWRSEVAWNIRATEWMARQTCG